MSLSIECTEVQGVLLADGWHEVEPESFCLDAYEFMDADYLVTGAGNGFQFTELGYVDGAAIISGPLTAVLAVRTAP